MHTLKISDTMSLINHVAIRHRESVMMWSQPGIGKSEATAQLAAQHGATKANKRFVDVRLGQYDSVDMRGFPGVDEDTELTKWYPPSTLPFKGNEMFVEDMNNLIFLFLDEINSAPPAVQAVAYQLINDKAIGEHTLMDNVVVIAAGNRESDRGVTTRMPTPLANRFTHVEVGLDLMDWSIYAQTKLPKAAAGVGVAFLQFRPPLLSTFDPSKPDKAFATPRTWFKALKYYADPDMPLPIKHAAMAGAVGDGPAAEFWGFVDVWQSITSISQIIKDPKGTKLPEEASMQYATAVNISGAMDRKNVNALHTYLSRMDPPFIVMAWNLAVKRDGDLFKVPEFLDLSKKYKAVFV